jgi:hypothetical protein
MKIDWIKIKRFIFGVPRPKDWSKTYTDEQLISVIRGRDICASAEASNELLTRIQKNFEENLKKFNQK